MNDELPPPTTIIHLPPPYRRGRGDTVVLIFLGAVIVLGIWKMGVMLNSPEPFAIPPTTPAVTPIDTTQEVQHIVIDNLVPTTVPMTTPWPIAPQPTTFVETLPICDSDKATPGALCAPIRVLPVPSPTPYQTCTSQSFHDSWSVVEPCIKPTETANSANVTNDLVLDANQYDHDRVHEDAMKAATLVSGTFWN